MFPEILNPEFKVQSLNPETFESGEFCPINDPDIFPPSNIWFCGGTKMAERVVVTSMAIIDGGRWLPHSVRSPGNLL